MSQLILTFLAGMATGIALMWASEWFAETILLGESVDEENEFRGRG